MMGEAGLEQQVEWPEQEKSSHLNHRHDSARNKLEVGLDFWSQGSSSVTHFPQQEHIT